MLIKHIAIISQTKRVTLEETTRIAAALQKQVMRDFAPIWKLQATVAAFATLEQVPSDYWPIIIRDDIGVQAGGVHLSSQGQPFALVDADSNVSLTCSHECLEMLADPYGNRFVAGSSLKLGQGRVNYLVEVCDPSEHYSYAVNGLEVSDFYTPDFFAPAVSPGVRYSYMGVIPAPRTVLSKGYISWMIPSTGEWWQLTYFGAAPEFRSLGVLKRNGKSWRELIDAATPIPAFRSKSTTKRKSAETASLNVQGLEKEISSLMKSNATKLPKGKKNTSKSH